MNQNIKTIKFVIKMFYRILIKTYVENIMFKNHHKFYKIKLTYQVENLISFKKLQIFKILIMINHQYI